MPFGALRFLSQFLEIDCAGVWCFIEGVQYAGFLSINYLGKKAHHYKGGVKYGEHGINYGCDQSNYTRSRDALKAIRKPEWTYAIDATAPEFLIDFEFHHLEKVIRGTAKTEELAELHAIIQAIEYERTHD